MAGIGYKSLTIPENTWNKLEAIRARKGLRSIPETVEALAEEEVEK